MKMMMAKMIIVPKIAPPLQTNSPTTILSDVTLVIGRTETRGRTTVAFAITAFLARSTLVVVRTGTRRSTTDAFAFIVFPP